MRYYLQKLKRQPKDRARFMLKSGSNKTHGIVEVERGTGKVQRTSLAKNSNMTREGFEATASKLVKTVVSASAE